MIILPSLEIVPAKYNGSTLLSQIPIDGTGDFTVSRTTSPVTGQSTRVNSLGFIETVADNTPRLDYLQPDGTVGCPSLLVEPSAQNLLQRSEEFNDAYWGKASGGTASAPVVTPNVELAPDGTNNADRVVFALNGGTTSTDLSSINSATLTHSSGSFTSSVYIRTTDGSTVTMTFVNADGTSTNRTITPTYQRITYTSTGAGTAQYRIRLRGGVTSNSASVAIWGAQYEAGSVATSYIPTTTGSVTRNADVVSVSGAVSGSIGQTEGTVFIDFVYRRNAPDGLIPILLTNTSADQVYVHIRPSGGIGVDYYYNSSFSAQLFTATGFVVNNTRYKVAFVYKENDFALYINGQQIATDNSGIVRSLTSLHLVYPYLTGYGPAGQTVNQAALYTTRLSNTQLALLTSPYTSYSSMASALSYTLG